VDCDDEEDGGADDYDCGDDSDVWDDYDVKKFNHDGYYYGDSDINNIDVGGDEGKSGVGYYSTTSG
jgi:hypothetical protein